MEPMRNAVIVLQPFLDFGIVQSGSDAYALLSSYSCLGMAIMAGEAGDLEMTHPPAARSGPCRDETELVERANSPASVRPTLRALLQQDTELRLSPHVGRGPGGRAYFQHVLQRAACAARLRQSRKVRGLALLASPATKSDSIGEPSAVGVKATADGGKILAACVLPPSQAIAAEEVEEKMRQFARLHDAIGHLPERYQTVLALRYFESMSYDEVADVLGKRIGTVKSLIHRGLERLKRQFEGNGATFLQNLHYQVQQERER